ncbi:MAG TPA: hypothetical protein VFU02_14095 [Polyangiaceae bacterium]|nr:hypothetical protein [Polyangiaceae bacterium]
MKAGKNGSHGDPEALGDLFATFAFELVEYEYRAVIQVERVEGALDALEPLRRFRDVGRTWARSGHRCRIVDIDLPGRTAQAAPPSGGNAHGNLSQPSRGSRLALDEAASFVSYYEHLLNQIVDFLRTNPKFPQKVRNEPRVAPEQLSCIEALFRLGLAFCHVLYVPLPWIAGCLKTFTPS